LLAKQAKAASAAREAAAVAVLHFFMDILLLQQIDKFGDKAVSLHLE